LAATEALQDREHDVKIADLIREIREAGTMIMNSTQVVVEAASERGHNDGIESCTVAEIASGIDMTLRAHFGHQVKATCEEPSQLMSLPLRAVQFVLWRLVLECGEGGAPMSAHLELQRERGWSVLHVRLKGAGKCPSRVALLTRPGHAVRNESPIGRVLRLFLPTSTFHVRKLADTDESWQVDLTVPCAELSELSLDSDAAAVWDHPHPSVAVVDDNKLNQRVLVRALEATSSPEIHLFDSGDAFISHCSTLADPHGVFDLVFVDQNMPGRDGCMTVMTFLERFPRRLYSAWSGRTDHAPVFIGCTADATRDTKAACLRAGMSIVLHKPFTRAEVAAVMRTASSLRHR
jgi:CheY-like chemotaxis protein